MAGDDVVSIPMSSTSCHARSNTVHSTWKLDGSDSISNGHNGKEGGHDSFCKSFKK